MGRDHRVDYRAGESSTACSAAIRIGADRSGSRSIIFLIESLQKFHYYLGDQYKVECPTGSGRQSTLWEVSPRSHGRLTHIFLQNAEGKRPVFGATKRFQDDPHWRNNVLFYEYFHGDNGSGIGASHQTGWTGLVAKLIQQTGE